MRFARTVIDPTGLDQHSFFTLPLGLTSRWLCVATGLHFQLAKYQMVCQLFDLMENAALVGHAIEMIIQGTLQPVDRKSTRLNSSHSQISYAVFCLKKKNT